MVFVIKEWVLWKQERVSHQVTSSKEFVSTHRAVPKLALAKVFQAVDVVVSVATAPKPANLSTNHLFEINKQLILSYLSSFSN